MISGIFSPLFIVKKLTQPIMVYNHFILYYKLSFPLFDIFLTP